MRKGFPSKQRKSQDNDSASSVRRRGRCKPEEEPVTERDESHTQDIRETAEDRVRPDNEHSQQRDRDAPRKDSDDDPEPRVQAGPLQRLNPNDM